MATAGKDRGSKESRERARVYQARQSFHEGLGRRRTRDNVIAGVVGGLVIAAVIVVQTLFFTVGPGTPAPEPTATTEPTSVPTPGEPTPAGTEPAPTGTDTPAPSPSATE